MTRKVVTVRAVGTYTVEFDGPMVHTLCEQMDIPKMKPRFGGSSAWLVPEQRANDLEAGLTARGYSIEIVL